MCIFHKKCRITLSLLEYFYHIGDRVILIIVIIIVKRHKKFFLK